MSNKVHRRPKESSKGLRNARIRTLAALGKKNSEIAREMGMEQKQVKRILTNEETHALIREHENELKQTLGEAIDVFKLALKEAKTSPEALGHGLRAATLMLKTYGLIRESVDLNHNFPTPTIIEKIEGGVVELTGQKEE